MILFSRPADFTPVCTTEFITFATLQLSDGHKVATPANWQRGDDVIVPPPGSCGSAKERVEKLAADTKALGGPWS